jgi:hypothetical protein
LHLILYFVDYYGSCKVYPTGNNVRPWGRIDSFRLVLLSSNMTCKAQRNVTFHMVMVEFSFKSLAFKCFISEPCIQACISTLGDDDVSLCRERVCVCVCVCACVRERKRERDLSVFSLCAKWVLFHALFSHSQNENIINLLSFVCFADAGYDAPLLGYVYNVHTKELKIHTKDL